MKARHVLSLLVPLAILATVLSACGSSSNTNDKTSEAVSTGAEGGSGSAEVKVEAPPTAPPESISIKEPLTKPPASGLELISLQCELPSCTEYLKPLEEATAALGWKFNSIVYSPTDPGSALSQAIAQKPDFIAITGTESALVKPQLAEAAAAGIPVVASGTSDHPSATGYASTVAPTLELDAQYIARWMAIDSGGHGKMLTVSIPSFNVLNTQTSWLDENLPTVCPGCTNETLDVNIAALGEGKVPTQVGGFLQTHPGIEYVYFAVGDLSVGVGAALQGVGLADSVKLIGCCGTGPVIQEIAEGKNSQTAWTVTGAPGIAWTMVDSAARISVGMDVAGKHQKEIEKAPTYVVDNAESAKELAPSEYHWRGPANFEQEFEELWGLK